MNEGLFYCSLLHNRHVVATRALLSTPASVETVLRAARALEDPGAISIVLEAMPNLLGTVGEKDQVSISRFEVSRVHVG